MERDNKANVHIFYKIIIIKLSKSKEFIAINILKHILY